MLSCSHDDWRIIFIHLLFPTVTPFFTKLILQSLSSYQLTGIYSILLPSCIQMHKLQGKATQSKVAVHISVMLNYSNHYHRLFNANEFLIKIHLFVTEFLKKRFMWAHASRCLNSWYKFHSCTGFLWSLFFQTYSSLTYLGTAQLCFISGLLQTAITECFCFIL